MFGEYGFAAWWRNHGFDTRHFRWWWERRTRGFDERETWCLTTTMLEFILPRLKTFPDCSVPGSFIFQEDGSEKPIKEAGIEWNKTRRKMERAMELWLEHEGHPPAEFVEEVDEGMDLFFKYFFNLWW